jgi:hypothetical protein
VWPETVSPFSFIPSTVTLALKDRTIPRLLTSRKALDVLDASKFDGSVDADEAEHAHPGDSLAAW